MKHPIFAVATTATFVAGVIVGHYAMPRSVRLSAPALNAANEISTRSSERTSPTLSISAPNQFDPAASLSENIIGAIENAAAHPGNRQLYSEVNDLIENLDPKDVRPVIDAIQHLPNPRERNTFMSMLITRWAEGDPRGALDYAQTENAAEKGWLVGEVVGTWAEHDSAAAMAWVTQTPPGSERNGALQSLVSALVEKDPRGALSFLQALPAADQTAALYSPIFSGWGSADPVTAGQVALQLPSGPIRDMALQVVGSRWSEQNAEAAYAWANGLPIGQGRDNAMQNILSHWAGTDPERAANAALGLPTGSGRDQAIADIAQQWAEKDPTAAAAYAAALSPGETKDLVITAIAQQLTSSDPQTALSWIEKLPDESMRQKALETCVAAVERNRSANQQPSLQCTTARAIHVRICWQRFLTSGHKAIPLPRLPGLKICQRQPPATPFCPVLSPWSLKIILVARPNWYRGFLVICSPWPRAHLFRSGPVPIRRPRAPGQLPFPMPKRAINFLPT